MRDSFKPKEANYCHMNTEDLDRIDDEEEEIYFVPMEDF